MSDNTSSISKKTTNPCEKELQKAKAKIVELKQLNATQAENIEQLKAKIVELRQQVNNLIQTSVGRLN